MSDIAISSILNQIRAFQARAQLQPALPSTTQSVTASGFSDVLNQTMSQVNGDLRNAEQLAQAFDLGQPNLDLSKVMLAQQSAQIGFKATVEARNRLVQAYQDIMNMPL